MPARRVTYAHKRRRVKTAREAIPPETDQPTRAQSMLKRSRRVALAENVEDKNLDHIREHLAKRIKRNQEHVSSVEDSFPEDTSFQTPSVREPALLKPPAPDQLSPVPVVKRAISRTSSRNLRENSTHLQSLASPFNSRPGSTAPSPKRRGKGVSRTSLHTKSRTLSGVFKENTRHVPRKGSSASLKEADKEPTTTRVKHQRYRSSPSTSYMRAQLAEKDWISPPKAISRTLDHDEEFNSPHGSVRSNASFYVDQPRSCSTPAMPRLRKLSSLHGRRTSASNFLVASSSRHDSAEASDLDVEMMNGTLPQHRRAIHLSSNSIFSSSGEFTIGALPANDGKIQRKNFIDRDDGSGRLSCRRPVEESQVGHTSTGSFLAEYEIPLSDSPAPNTVTMTLDPGKVPKRSIGKVPFDLPGTAHDGIPVRKYRNPPSNPAEGLVEDSESEMPLSYTLALTVADRESGDATVPAVCEVAFDLPGTSPAHGGSIIVRGYRNPPSSPLSGLAEELSSMGLRGGQSKPLGGKTRRPSALVPPHARSEQGALAKTSAKKPVHATPARNRAGTIRASDFARPGVSSADAAPGSTASLLPTARRTRSGTVVGPDSKLADKDVGSSAGAAKGVRRAVVEIESEESDDELLSKHRWTENVEYLSRAAVPANRKEVEADEMNLGGLWHGLEFGPPRRLGLRRR